MCDSCSCLPTYHELNDEDDGEVGGEEAYAAVLTVDANDGLADEGQVYETSVRVAEGEAKELQDEGILVLRSGTVVLEVFGGGATTWEWGFWSRRSQGFGTIKQGSMDIVGSFIFVPGACVPDSVEPLLPVRETANVL